MDTPSPVQHNRVYSRLLPFHSPNSLSPKVRKSSPLTVNVFTQRVNPTDRSSPVWLLSSAAALIPYSKLHSTWTASHHTWALTSSSPLQRDPTLSPGAYISLTVSSFSLLLVSSTPAKVFLRMESLLSLLELFHQHQASTLKMFFFYLSWAPTCPGTPLTLLKLQPLTPVSHPLCVGCPPYSVWALTPSKASSLSQAYPCLLC